MVDIARKYISFGLSVIPCRNKQPLLKSWKPFQNALMGVDDIESYFKMDTPQIAVVTGAVSGGLELLDFDLKILDVADRDEWWDNFYQSLLSLSPELASRLVISKTGGGGYHIVYRCELIEGNQKLARVKSKNGKYETLIETRGEGGYFIAPPSKGYCFVKSNFEALPVLSLDERDELMNLCRSFHEEIPLVSPQQKKVAQVDTQFSENPFTAYNNSDACLSILIKNGWSFVADKGNRLFYKRPGASSPQSGNWNKSLRLFYMHSSGDSILEPGKAYNGSMIYNLFVCQGDWKDTFKALINEGYGTKWNDDDKAVISNIRSSLKAGVGIDEVKEKLVKLKPFWSNGLIEKALAVAQIEENLFWYYEKSRLKIDNLKFTNFLHNELGYALYTSSVEKKKPILKLYYEVHQVTRIESNDFIKNDVRIWLKKNIDDDGLRDEILSGLIVNGDKLFSEKIYEWLPPASFKTFTDTKEFAYFFFRNGIVRVSSETIDLIDYRSLPDGYFIWQDRIKNKEFDIEILKDDEFIYLQSSWAKFVRRICGILPDDDHLTISEISSTNRESANRFLSTMTCLGYLLHAYKDPSRPWSVIIQEDTSIDSAGGGSGKQIINNSLKTLRNVIEEDGKQLDVTKQFAFQGISEETDIYILDDVKKNFKIEPMYRMITNDMTVEVRNVGRKHIAFESSPKIVFTTNYDLISSDANHLARRIKLLLVHCYFGPKRIPKSELGMLLTDEWDKEQWTLFFNFMFNCTMLYLKSSIIEVGKTAAMKEKAVRVQYGDDFYEFMLTFISSMSDDVAIPKWAYDDFLDSYKIDKRFYSYSKFRKGMLMFFEFKNYEVEIIKDYRSGGGMGFDERVVDKQLGYRVRSC